MACEGVSQLCHCAGCCCRRVHNKHLWLFKGAGAVILTGHKMEKTGKHFGRGEGRLLLISCLCTETCFIKTLQPAVSLIFTDRPKGHKWRKEAIFFSFIFTTLHLLQTLVVHNKLLKQPFYLFLLSPYFRLHIHTVEDSSTRREFINGDVMF